MLGLWARRHRLAARVVLFSYYFFIVSCCGAGAYVRRSYTTYDCSHRSRLELSATPLRVFPFATKLYVLNDSYQIPFLCRTYNITPHLLKILNARLLQGLPLESLKQGDIIIIPQHRLAYPFPQSSSLKNNGEAYLENMARSLSERSFKQAIINEASTVASTKMENFLNRYGTAAVELNYSDKFHLDRADLDVLLPLWDCPQYLFFVQGGAHRSAARLQSSVGAGLRYFSQFCVIGGNVFFDYDFKHTVSRFGAGLEYGRDFLRLSVNTYWHLSHWGIARDDNSSVERAANGWDIRAEAYWPSHPQWGGKLFYESYFGRNVVFGQAPSGTQNPYAVTLNVNYTPVPLLAFNANYQLVSEQTPAVIRKGSFDLGVRMNYQLGVPLSSQLAPSAVKKMHTLMGSRYDLVSRNNDIVLEYKKNSFITLSAPTQLVVEGEKRKIFPLSVHSQWPIKEVSFFPLDGGFRERGGSIAADEKDFTKAYLVAPRYDFTSMQKNLFTIRAQAVDSQGHLSNSATISIMLKPPQKNDFRIDFDVKTVHLRVGGGEKILTFTLTKNGAPFQLNVKRLGLVINPVSNGADKIYEMLAQEQISSVLSKITPAAQPGVYQFAVKPAEKAEIFTITPAVKDLANLQTTSVKIVVGKDEDKHDKSFVVDSKKSTAEVYPTNVLASGCSKINVSGYLADKDGNRFHTEDRQPVKHVSIELHSGSATGPVIKSVEAEVSPQDGAFKALAVPILAEKPLRYYLTVRCGDVVINSGKAIAILVRGLEEEFSSLQAAPDAAPADGITPLTLKLYARDQFGDVSSVAEGFKQYVSFRFFNENGQPIKEKIFSFTGALHWDAESGAFVAAVVCTRKGSYRAEALWNGKSVGKGIFSAVHFNKDKEDFTIDEDKSTFLVNMKSFCGPLSEPLPLTFIFKARNKNGKQIVFGKDDVNLTFIFPHTRQRFNLKYFPGVDMNTRLVQGGKNFVAELETKERWGLVKVFPVYRGQPLFRLAKAVTLCVNGKSFVPDQDKSSFSCGYADNSIVADKEQSVRFVGKLVNKYGDFAVGGEVDLTIAPQDGVFGSPIHWKVKLDNFGAFATVVQTDNCTEGRYDINVTYCGRPVISSPMVLKVRGLSGHSSFQIPRQGRVASPIKILFYPADSEGRYFSRESVWPQVYNRISFQLVDEGGHSVPTSLAVITKPIWDAQAQALAMTVAVREVGAYRIQANWCGKKVAGAISEPINCSQISQKPQFKKL